MDELGLSKKKQSTGGDKDQMDVDSEGTQVELKNTEDELSVLLKPLQDITEQDLYKKLKHIESELEFHDIQEEYVKYEQKNLKRELMRAKEEVKRIKSVPLV